MTLRLLYSLERLWTDYFKKVKMLHKDPKWKSYLDLDDWVGGSLENLEGLTTLTMNELTILYVLYHATEEVGCRKCGHIEHWPGPGDLIDERNYAALPRYCCKEPSKQGDWPEFAR